MQYASYYPYGAAPASSPLRPTANPPYLSPHPPPATFDRRRAHILSEQKRRESINGGFYELKQKLTSDHISRAIAYSLTGCEPEGTPVFDSHTIFGPSSRESKALTLKRAGTALQALADKVSELKVENDGLRAQVGGQGQVRRNANYNGEEDEDVTYQERCL